MGGYWSWKLGSLRSESGERRAIKIIMELCLTTETESLILWVLLGNLFTSGTKKTLHMNSYK